MEVSAALDARAKEIACGEEILALPGPHAVPGTFSLLARHQASPHSFRYWGMCALSHTAQTRIEGEPSMTRTMRRVFLLAALTTVLCLLPLAGAYANLDSPPANGVLGTSNTNPSPMPSDPQYATMWWRQGWGNSLRPQMSLIRLTASWRVSTA